MSDAHKIFETYAKVVEEGFKLDKKPRYRSYSVSTLRGGVGKSTLSFNLAYEMSREVSVLVGDLCPQRNLTESLMRGVEQEVTVFQALQPKILGEAFGSHLSDISYRISKYCDAFKGGRPAYFVPGDPEMFAFPSTLYQQLQIANARNNANAVRSLLHALSTVLEEERQDKNCDTILLDTSPFYAGGTHLAWCASEAIIIPVRVDEHSIESLSLTLDMLSNPGKDFMMWNERAGGLASPRVAAIVMTMAGARSATKSVLDGASQMYIQRAMKLAEKHAKLFDGDPSDSFAITDDFVSAGRISGAQSIPISQLKVGKFHTVEGKRLQVNQSVIRYQHELAYLTSII
ncbi:ParA family protein [Cupriavidus sp. H18C2]|uniref:ParA family protein n=1 Tax=Cupriavidus sp. H18C2 TaxID=3241602 RepID=UPI003BF78459